MVIIEVLHFYKNYVPWTCDNIIQEMVIYYLHYDVCSINFLDCALTSYGVFAPWA